MIFKNLLLKPNRQSLGKFWKHLTLYANNLFKKPESFTFCHVENIRKRLRFVSKIGKFCKISVNIEIWEIFSTSAFGTQSVVNIFASE